MKHLLALLLLVCPAAFGQLGQRILTQRTDPSGSCVARIPPRYNEANGKLHLCKDVDGDGTGVWTWAASVDFSEMSGTVTDAQVPNTITIDLATAASALAANGANCTNANEAAAGVSAAGVAEGCRPVPQIFFGTAAPGSVSGNRPGDLYSDTTNHKLYWCNATSGTAAPACTSVTTGGWTENTGGTVCGSNKQVQYNSSGSCGAEAGFEYDPATNTLSVDKINVTGAASETILTCLSGDPSAPATDKIALYCLTSNQRLKYYPEGGSATYVADGNSSGEATKGVAGAYDPTSWNGSSETPTKDAVRDKIESMSSGGASTLSFSYPPVQDGAGWRASTLAAFSGDNNAVGYYNWNETDGSKYALVKGIVPAGWTSGAVTAYITFQGSGSGNAIQWKVSVSCDQGDTFSTADNFSSQTTSGSTRYRLSKTLTLTSCSATNSIIYKIQRVDTNGVGYIFAFDVTYAIP